MSRTRPEYFERLYRNDPDPWGFATSWYERRKYALTAAALPAERYRSGFEPGCSIGVLTEMLAPRCAQLLAVDLNDDAVSAARSRLSTQAHVRVERSTIPDQWPAGPFDLLVLSEVCYYFDPAELVGLIERATASLEPEATVIAVHWRGETDYPLTASATHSILAGTPSFVPVAHLDDPGFLLDVWGHQPDRTRRTPPQAANRPR
jgi:trans-aconitate methyltransferase